MCALLLPGHFFISICQIKPTFYIQIHTTSFNYSFKFEAFVELLCYRITHRGYFSLSGKIQFSDLFETLVCWKMMVVAYIKKVFMNVN